MKKLSIMLMEQKRKLVKLWEKVVKSYLELKAKPGVGTFLKFILWLLALVVKTAIKLVLTKVLDFFLNP